MQLGSFYILFLSVFLLSSVSAFTEEPLENVAANEQPQSNVTTPPVEELVLSDETKPEVQLLVETVETQGHENAGERKARQFGYPGFGYAPPPRPYYGGGFGGGFGGGYGGGFQRTRVVTRTRVVNRVRGGGFYGGGYFG